MTQEERELLLADLCARSPYKVKVQIDFGEHCSKYGIDRYVDDTVICVWPETFEIGVNDEDQACDIEDVRPYLRPMSSMTEEEYIEYRTIQGRNCDYGEATICVSKSLYSGLLYDDNEPLKITVYYPNPVIQNWLNKKMFDFRGLIPMGLAIEAPKDMYVVKN